MLLNSNGKCLHTQKRLAQQGGKTMSSLINSLKQLYVTKEQQMYLFDSMVGSVLGYASEIWGFHRARDIDFMHNLFCRYVLKLGKNVPLPFLYGELGHFPLHVYRHHNILKYWYHIWSVKPPIVYEIYKLLLTDANKGKNKWASNVKDLLCNLGFNDLWISQDPGNFSLEVIKLRIKDQYLQLWFSVLEECNKLDIYMRIRLECCIEKYLDLHINVQLLTKIVVEHLN
jgi:hypothetical protein